MKKADLHIHTRESDGSLSVEEVVLTASCRGLNTIAITDHDTTLGVGKAQQLAGEYGISIIPGVEISTNYKQEEIHLLGYYKDINSDLLQERLLQLRKIRTKIAGLMVEELNRNGISVDWEKVRAAASQDGAICKAHIMHAIRNGRSEAEQIDWNTIAAWFRPGGIAYIPYEGNPYTEAVDFIYETGGLPVLAHPGLIRNKSLIGDLLAYRPIGLEVYYGYWEQQEEKIAYFEALAQKKAVLSTGGSDYHGLFSPIGLGQVLVPEKCIEDLKNYLQLGE